MIAQVDADLVRTFPRQAARRLAATALVEGRPLLSRARWLDRPAQHVGRWLCERDGAEAPRSAFVVGCGRSGTTLTARLLGSHPDAVFLDEPKLLWHLAHGDEDVVGTYRREPGRLRLFADDARPAVARRLANAHANVARLARVSTVIDKYPEAVFRVPFVRAVFPGAPVVVVLRPWQAVVDSILRWDAAHADAASDVGWWGLGDRKLAGLLAAVSDLDPATHSIGLEALDVGPRRVVAAAIEWTAVALQVLALDHDDSSLVPVWYDDLVTSPRAVLTPMLAALGLDGRLELLRFAERAVRPPPTETRGLPDLPGPLTRALGEIETELMNRHAPRTRTLRH